MEQPIMKGYRNNPENMSPRGMRRNLHEKKISPSRSSRHHIRHNFSPSGRDGRDRPSKSRIDIPVEFVDDFSPSESRFQANKKKNFNNSRPKMSPTAAAVKIQAVYRGFCVRSYAPLKNLKAIAQAKESMEEAKRRINDEHVVELIRQNEKERLRITEGLMSLLLKLDAIQGVNTIVRESRKAVIRELVKLQETVDAITAEKNVESETPTKKPEESVLPNKESSPEGEHVPMDIQASESNAASPPNSEFNSLENSLEKKIILSDLENALEKKIVLNENENENNKDLHTEKYPETSPGKKIPEEKEEMVYLDKTMDSSGSLKDSSEGLKYSSEPIEDSSKPIKDSSELLKDSFEPVKDSSEPVEESSGPVTFSTGGDVNDDEVDDYFDNQEQASSYLPQMEINESGSAEEDFRSANREAILQEAFEMLDQIKSRIAEGQGQVQKDIEMPLQGNEAINIVGQDKVKLKEVVNEPEHSSHSMECSEYRADEDTSNQEKLLQQDGICEVNNSEEADGVKKSEGTNNDMELLQQDGITEANNSEEPAGVKKSEGTNNDMELSQQDEIPEANNSEEAVCIKKESFTARPEDNNNGPRDESTTNAVENVWEENKKLKKVIEDLYQRNQMQNDIMSNISKKLEQLEKRMLQLNNNKKKCMGKRKRT